MSELRAALAIARKDIRNLSRYRVAVASLVFTPLYQFVIPAFLFGSAFGVGGRAAGLSATLGTDDLVGFIFVGGLVSGTILSAFWGVAMALRNEMDVGTLEPSWLTPTRHDTFVIGRALGSLFWFAGAQVALFAFGVAFLGLRLRPEMLIAAPALLLAIFAMLGVAYALAAVVLLIREANFFIDTMSFAFAIMCGISFPVTLLPGVLKPIALALPPTYAVDLLRFETLGARPLLDPLVEYAVLIAGTIILYPLGRAAFGAADRAMRRRGMIGQY